MRNLEPACLVLRQLLYHLDLNGSRFNSYVGGFSTPLAPKYLIEGNKKGVLLDERLTNTYSA